MAKPLRYADAVKLLGGTDPAVGNLLGGVLSLATAGGSEAALSWFDAKNEMVRLGHLVTGGLRDSVRGYGRFDRNQRLQAAHAVLVVTSFFEAFDGVADFPSPEFTRDDQMLLVAGAVPQAWIHGLLTAQLPAPSADRSYDRLLTDLSAWYASFGAGFATHLQGLAEWEAADERARRAVLALLTDRLPEVAVDRYEQAHRRLAVDIPEFAIWLQRTDSQAIGRSLTLLESTLRQVTAGRDPDRLRRALADAYRSELDRPILGGGDAGELTVPLLGAAYVDSRFQVRRAGANARPADERWWVGTPRTDLAAFLATYLTTPQAAESPMLMLGHPGAGKSALTRILAARLPASDFLAVRVVLREVPAEAEIQDQIEQALRSAIGRTVSWPDLAEGAGDAMPVVMLDGFDELLQATGIHQSDYLLRVAEFQRREAVQKRPVAVIVTSRVAVADRARLPEGGLVVRLEPFDAGQVAQWLDTWNAANAEAFRAAGTLALTAGALDGVRDLAAQPLLLLMLALYDATGNALQREGSALDTIQLYDRLLREFAAREVRRLHRGRPDTELAALVDEELMRLSVVAFAMFNRSRQWVTEQELDEDLAGLRIEPSRPAATEAFRSSMTAGQELVGRFFFIQRAQALQEGRQHQTYEFLHATFGEYLVARLVVQALQDAAARSAVGSLRLRSAEPDDDLLQSLLGYLPLTARNTVLSYAVELLAAADRATIRLWLLRRLNQALTVPSPTSRGYRPGTRRIDHWMATYSLNLVLLTLACGAPLRATEIFPDDAEPSARLRRAGLVWRGSTASGKWMDVAAAVSVTRTWTDGRRDLVLTLGAGAPQPVDPLWSHHIEPGAAQARPEMIVEFPLPAALTSMALTNNLGDDAVLHAVQPFITHVPETLTHFTVHGPGDAESIAHGLTALMLTSLLSIDIEELTRVYDRACVAFSKGGWAGTTRLDTIGKVQTVILRSLRRDAGRLRPDDVLRWLRLFADEPDHSMNPDNREVALDCLDAVPHATSRWAEVRRALGGAGSDSRPTADEAG